MVHFKDAPVHQNELEMIPEGFCAAVLRQTQAEIGAGRLESCGTCFGFVILFMLILLNLYLTFPPLFEEGGVYKPPLLHFILMTTLRGRLG